MKYSKYIITTFICCFLFLGNSCNLIDSDINVDPNNPTDVPMSLLLPSAQLGSYFVYGNDNARLTSIWMQQSSGTDRQYIPLGRYTVTESDVNNSWGTAYNDAMNDYQVIIGKSNEADTENSYYRGIAKIMLAATLGVVTDLWNDVPYSEAFQGVANLTPAYDSQETVYNTIQGLLSDGKNDLQNNPVGTPPSTDDLIYGGDISKWVKAANALSARYHLHLTARDGNAAATAALNALGSADILSSNDDDAQGTFGTSITNANFWYLFNTIERAGYLSAGKYLVDLMASINDPRMPAYFTVDADGGFSGSAAGAAELSKSTTGPAFASSDSPVPIITFVEQKFIEAEANFRLGNAAAAADAHNAAIMASLNKHNVSDQAFVDAEASEDAGSITLEKILTHKYIALYTQIEVYNDWRRNDFPADLGTAQNAAQTDIPVRLPYPQDERLFNGDNLPAATINDKVWWDAN